MVKSAYIHIPFCNKKCYYCNFLSYESLTYKNIYIDALLKQIKHYYEGDLLETIYIGGGTPSLLSLNDFENILSLLIFNNKTEVTVELNPENITLEYLRGLKQLGVNRLSQGVQVFDDKLLKLIGRKHTKENALNTVKMAKNVGFQNISIDLIYGLPEQDIKSFENSLDIAIDMDLQHISLYGLKIEEKCHFFTHRPKNIATNDEQADMYLLAKEKLEKAGFKHYEISNFSKNNFQSRHNLTYWNNEQYYGFGVGASGYVNNYRYSNADDIEQFIANPFEYSENTLVDEKTKLEEEIFLGLRKLEGINISDINKKFGINFEEKYKKVLTKYQETGHLIKDNGYYYFSTKGILQSNFILCEFV